jgi:polysaccharide export outer membrane protein
MKYRPLQSDFKKIILPLVLICAFAACRTNKNIAYFKDIPDSLYADAKNIAVTKFVDPKIQPNDILQISILTLDQTVNAMINSDNPSFSVQPGSQNVQATVPQVSGFLVDKDGTVELPTIGKIKLLGLTTAEARDSIHAQLAVYYKSPIVNVKFTNFSITVLGEVSRPSTYIVPNEKVSILDAIGLAGDLTIYGKRENVLLIRDTLGQKQFIRFNLNSSKTISSPYFYLKQGDMVYVEPNKSKIASSDGVQIRNYALLASLITVFITIISRI